MKRFLSRAGVVAAIALAMAGLGALHSVLPAAAESGEVSSAVMDEGEALYLVNCRQCHGTKGTAGVPLASSDKLGDADYVGTTIITGPGYMAAFGEHLDDEQIAAIATYVRNSWGNAFGPVEPGDIAALR